MNKPPDKSSGLCRNWCIEYAPLYSYLCSFSLSPARKLSSFSMLSITSARLAASQLSADLLRSVNFIRASTNTLQAFTEGVSSWLNWEILRLGGFMRLRILSNSRFCFSVSSALSLLISSITAKRKPPMSSHCRAKCLSLYLYHSLDCDHLHNFLSRSVGKSARQ